MPNIIFTRSKRGITSQQEFDMFYAVKENDTVFMRCRVPSCWRSWPISLSEYLLTDLTINPVDCPVCGSFNVTSNWVDFNERPKTYIDEEFHTYNVNGAPILDQLGRPTGQYVQIPTIGPVHQYRKEYQDAITAMDQFRATNGAGANPPWDTEYYKIIRETMWCDIAPNNEHYDEMFHEVILEDDLASWTHDSTNRVKYNNAFYRAIMNMIIQTEVVVTTP